MRIAIFLILALTFQNAFAGEKKDPLSIEMIDGATSRGYSLISPISSQKGSVDKAFDDLRKKGAKLGADAVVEIQCSQGMTAQTPQRETGLIGLLAKTKVPSQCYGKAVKWTEKENVISQQRLIDEAFDRLLFADGFIDKNGDAKNENLVNSLSAETKAYLDSKSTNPKAPSIEELNAAYASAKSKVIGNKTQ
jgi:uncharacterized protein YbjQ (UPF0145 family)